MSKTTSTEELYSIFRENREVTTDSRNVPSGAVFFALKGDRFDGNSYTNQALQNGASHAVIDDETYFIPGLTILVNDTLKALQDLAAFHRDQFTCPVIAITGTNGKTTTKELIREILSKKYPVIANHGNLNNHIGVPLTLLRLTKETGIVIIEMGASHPGEIDLLCRIARPTCGIITNIGKAHLDGFGDFEGVIRTKTELYRYLKNTNGNAFVNAGNKILMDHVEGLSIITYGLGGEEWLHGKMIPGELYASLELSFSQERCFVRSRLFGDYNAENILAAACIGQFFHVDRELIIDAIEHYEPENNRSQLKQTENNLLVLDAYNANPTSMQAALEHFASSSYSDKVVIAGDMLELGAEAETEHLTILKLIEELNFPEVYLVGPLFTKLCTKIEWTCFYDSDLAKLWFDHHGMKGKTILIKGSRGIQLEKVVGSL